MTDVLAWPLDAWPHHNPVFSEACGLIVLTTTKNEEGTSMGDEMTKDIDGPTPEMSAVDREVLEALDAVRGQRKDVGVWSPRPEVEVLNKIAAALQEHNLLLAAIARRLGAEW